MSLSGTFRAGTELLFSVAIYDAVTKRLADPTEVAFSYSVGGGTPVTTTYPGGGVIVKVGVGEYSCLVSTIDMAAPGTVVGLVGQWDTEGTFELSGDIEVLLQAPRIPSPF